MATPLDPHTLGELVTASVRGDRAAFRRLYEAHVQRVHAQVARMVGWGAVAEDVVQEVFIEVHRSLSSFAGQAEFGTWLHRLTRNVTISYLRRRGTNTVDLASYRALAEAVFQPDLDARRQVGALYAALDELPLDAREAFVAFEIEGQSLAAIAALSGEPLHTVASRIRRTRERLRQILERVATGWRKAR